MKAFLAAIRFLTILPLPSPGENEETHLSRALPFFPVVGLLIGIAVAGLDMALGHIFPPVLATGLVVITLIVVSGGLHLDGLADTADGFFSARPREKILNIMRDSRTGPMGVVAIVCIVGLKFAAVASLMPEKRWAAILLMPLAGRCALVILLALLPYARTEGGLATVFQKNHFVLNVLWAAGVLTLIGWLVATTTGMAIAAISLIGMLMLAAYIYSKIGGYTGDTLGAACEIVELIPVLVAAAMSHMI